jgi:hypothetical protein
MVTDNAQAVNSASPLGQRFPEPRAIIGGLQRSI